MSVREYVGARYVPIVVGEWDKTRTYEPLMVVTYQGASYTSMQYVPANIEITNESYWVLSANYNAQVDAYRKEVNAFDGRISANETAILNEVTRAKTAEETNATAILNEVTRAKTAEETNASAIANEVKRAEEAEQTNATAIADNTENVSAILKNNNLIVTPTKIFDIKIPSGYKVDGFTADSNYFYAAVHASDNTDPAIYRVNRSSFETSILSLDATYHSHMNWLVIYNTYLIVQNTTSKYVTIIDTKTFSIIATHEYINLDTQTQCACSYISDGSTSQWVWAAITDARINFYKQNYNNTFSLFGSIARNTMNRWTQGLEITTNYICTLNNLGAVSGYNPNNQLQFNTWSGDIYNILYINYDEELQDIVIRNNVVFTISNSGQILAINLNDLGALFSNKITTLPNPMCLGIQGNFPISYSTTDSYFTEQPLASIGWRGYFIASGIFDGVSVSGISRPDATTNNLMLEGHAIISNNFVTVHALYTIDTTNKKIIFVAGKRETVTSDGTITNTMYTPNSLPTGHTLITMMQAIPNSEPLQYWSFTSID